MRIDLTLDNHFRNPFHWNEFHISKLEKPIIFGFIIDTYSGNLEELQFGKFLRVTFYFYKKYYRILNIKIRKI